MQRRRYSGGVGAEGEFQPGSRRRVLRNKPGLTRVRDVNQVEYDALLRVQEACYEVIATDTRFTAAMIREMHYDLFSELSELYEWAGEYHKINVSKGEFAWPQTSMVPQNMDRLERDDGKAYPVPAPIERIATDIAIVHAELLLVHPFRDGNGRIGRLIADLMALQAGYPPLDFAFEGRGSRVRRQDYILAMQAGYDENYGPLERIVQEAIQRSLSGSA